MSQEQPNLTKNDQKYLQHIAEALRVENSEAFNFKKLPLSWLTTDQLRTSAIYWSKYSRTQPFGSLAATGTALLLAPWVYYLISLGMFGLYPNRWEFFRGFSFELLISTIQIIGMYILLIVIVKLVIGHSLALLLFLPKKNRKFDPDPMKPADHLAVKWTLQRHKLLPKREARWLRRMEEKGVVTQAGKDSYKLTRNRIAD